MPHTRRQLHHHEAAAKAESKPLARLRIVCDRMHTPENRGMVFRLAEAFGVEHLYFVETPALTSNSRLRRTSCGTFDQTSFTDVVDGAALMRSLKDDGFTIIALELTTDSFPLSKADFSGFERLVVVLGSEKYGLHADLLTHANYCVHIPMFGKNSSMNVVQALAIGLYALRAGNEGE